MVLQTALSTKFTHELDLKKFDEIETVENGTRPIYNTQSCRKCHQNRVSGGSSQINELRIGKMDRSGRSLNPDVSIASGAATIHGRSVINDQAICP